MQVKPVESILAALERLSPAKEEGKGWRNRCPPPDQPVIEQPDSWRAAELLEILIATVRIGLDGEKVVDLAAACPKLYGQGELWWPLDRLREGILPQRRADD